MAVGPALPDATPAPLADASPSEPTAAPVSDVEALAWVSQTIFETDAGYACYALGDFDRDFAHAVRPTDGFVTIDLHGTARGFRIELALLTPEQLGAALRELDRTGLISLPPGVGIRLVSCDTGAGGSGSPAAALARALGRDVLAPDQPVWTTRDGLEVVSSPRMEDGFILPTLPPDGAWHHFDPTGREVPPD